MSEFDVIGTPSAGVSRRNFLGALGAGAGAVGLYFASITAAYADEGDGAKEKSGRKGILFDGTKCVGCHYCEGGCKKSNGLASDVFFDVKALAGTVFPKELLPYKKIKESAERAPVLADDRDASRWLRVVRSVADESAESDADKCRNIRHSCTHCGLCASVCPSRALKQRDDGIVTVEPELCIGCKYCYQACPYNIPRFAEDGEDKAIRKCTMCADRVDAGEEPACVAACPADALQFGDWEDMVAAGKKAAEAAGGSAEFYGENEVGGLGVLYVLPASAKECGLPKVR